MEIMWRWMGDERQRGPLPGVPGRDLDDAEFEVFAGKYDARFYEGALAASGLYEHIERDEAAQEPQDGPPWDEAGTQDEET